MKKLILATNNKSKLNEIQDILKDLDINIENLSQELGDIETADSFLGNAIIKAKKAAELTGEFSLADDSGLCVCALNNEPSIYSARYFKNGQGLLEILDRLKDNPNRKAFFVCSLALVNPKQEVVWHCEETWQGSIAHEISGKNGFGYDPIFIPENYNCTAAELNPQEKNEISHRAKALKVFREYLTPKTRIYKIFGHFYYVKVNQKTIETTLPTRLQKEGVNALVGDFVEINLINKTIEKVEKRISVLNKPKSANIDQALIMLSLKSPDPDFNYLDKLLFNVSMALPKKPIICVSKIDLLSKFSPCQGGWGVYKNLGYKVIGISNILDVGINELKENLYNNLTIIAGKSGVGKSSLIKKLCPEMSIKIGNLSKKTNSGMHTTRHSEIFEIEDSKGKFCLLDTPGFNNFEIEYMPEDILKSNAFPEIERARNKCKFPDCTHLGEEGCCVEFSESRRESYKRIMIQAFEWKEEQNKLRKVKEKKLKINSETKIPLLGIKGRNVSRKSVKQKKEV